MTTKIKKKIKWKCDYCKQLAKYSFEESIKNLKTKDIEIINEGGLCEKHKHGMF